MHMYCYIHKYCSHVWMCVAEMLKGSISMIPDMCSLKYWTVGYNCLFASHKVFCLLVVFQDTVLPAMFVTTLNYCVCLCQAWTAFLVYHGPRCLMPLAQWPTLLDTGLWLRLPTSLEDFFQVSSAEMLTCRYFIARCIHNIVKSRC